MNILSIIQARGGSKGIPGKNIKDLCGKPLIGWTIEASQKSKLITRTLVSTDDPAIRGVSLLFGAEVPFLRPTEYATDGAKSLGLLTHALVWLQENEGYVPDLIVQLKPTNPLRTSKHIDACIKDISDASSDVDSLITVTKSPAHPLKTYQMKDGYVTPFVPESLYGIKEASKSPRQSLPEAYVQNSCVNIIKPKTILEKKSSLGTVVIGHVMNRQDSINIDDLLDFRIAELLMSERLAE